MGFAGEQLVETERGIQKISKIDPEGLIKVLNGKWFSYFHKRIVGEDETLVIDLESGKTLECSSAQRIMTVHGFASAGDLRIGEMLAGTNANYKPPKPSEREIREDLDDLYEDLPMAVKESLSVDKVMRVRKDKYVKDLYCLFVPRWHCFQTSSGVIVSNLNSLEGVGNE